MNLFRNCLTRAALFAVLVFCFNLHAQESTFKEAFEVDFDTVRFKLGDQNLGAGVGFRYMPKSWLGVQLQVSILPENLFFHDADSGGEINQYSSSLLLGHRWKALALYAEGGFGDFQSSVYAGYLAPYYEYRNLPEILLGGLLDIPVGRRLSLTYEVRDNLVFISDFTQQVGPGQTVVVLATKTHSPQGKFGITLHYNNLVHLISGRDQ